MLLLICGDCNKCGDGGKGGDSKSREVMALLEAIQRAREMMMIVIMVI